MSNRTKKNNKSTVVRIICLSLAALMIFSVIAGAIWH